MTFDSGAPVFLVPVELVKPHEFMGSTQKCKGILAPQEWSIGRVANINITVGSESSIPESWHYQQLNWTGRLFSQF